MGVASNTSPVRFVASPRTYESPRVAKVLLPQSSQVGELGGARVGAVVGHDLSWVSTVFPKFYHDSTPVLKVVSCCISRHCPFSSFGSSKLEMILLNPDKNTQPGHSQRGATGAFASEPCARGGHAADVCARGASGAAIQSADPSAPPGGAGGACRTAGAAGGTAGGATGLPSHRGPMGTSAGATGAAGQAAAATAGLAAEVQEGWLSLRFSSDQGCGFKTTQETKMEFPKKSHCFFFATVSGDSNTWGGLVCTGSRLRL